MSKKVILMILDGWGIAQQKNASAIDQAKTPFINSLYEKYPHSFLQASGLEVGLPEGQMGNSEVGHTNLGAGRIVYQDLVRINKSIQDGDFFKNKVLLNAFSTAKKKNKVHLMGLVSDGGVHSHINHLIALTKMASEQGIENIYIHVFTDGRDTDPKSGLGFISLLKDSIKEYPAQIVSIIGRYFAMDRDNRWERIKKAYDLLIHGIGTPYQDEILALQDSYTKECTDEFIEPILLNNQPSTRIEENDTVVCFNFRTDRGRQITQALTQQDFPEFSLQKLKLHYYTLTNYDENFKNVTVVFNKDNLSHTLGEVLEKNKKKQIRIAETEKYPHVTFFFSGGRELPFEGEKRILCPSPKVATYDLKPEMSADQIVNSILPELEKGEVDFVCLNFANPDMVGHTGVFEAVVKACETVDNATKKVVEAALKNNYISLLIADHGNAEYMINEDGSPNTAHTTNLVPFILIDNSTQYSLSPGRLCDIAPTILSLMNLEKPLEMNGISLVRILPSK